MQASEQSGRTALDAPGIGASVGSSLFARLECRQSFARCVTRPDERIDLARAALWLAAEEYPDLDPEVYLGRLESLAERVRHARSGRHGGMAALNALRRVLAHEEGFRGNTEDYYDPRNSFLNEVLERKVGIPISLSVVYLGVARRAEIPLEGVNMPGHFLVRLLDPGGPLLVDPFQGGTVLTAEQCARRLRATMGEGFRLTDEHLAAVGPRQILVRMLTNLRMIYLKGEDYARALAAVDRIALILGDTPRVRRDRGLLCSKLQLYGKAWADLAASLRVPVTDDSEESGEDEQIDAIREHLERVRGLAATPN